MASGLAIDGKRLNIAAPWPSAQRGGPGTRSRKPYTAEDCWAAIEACARALGRWPTSTAYIRWSRERRRRARELGLPDPRIPHYRVIRRLLSQWPRSRSRIQDAVARPAQ